MFGVVVWCCCCLLLLLSGVVRCCCPILTRNSNKLPNFSENLSFSSCQLRTDRKTDIVSNLILQHFASKAPKLRQMVQNTRRKTFKWRVRLYGLAEHAAPVWTADVGSLRSATVRQAVFVLSLLYLSLFNCKTFWWKRPIGRPRGRCRCNIQTDLK